MKNGKKIGLGVLLLVVVGIVFFGMSRQGSALEDTIKVGMSGSYKPYTFLDESGTLTGFDVEVWEAIAAEMGLEVAFVTSDFSGLFGMLDVGQIDTIANQITVTDERKEKYLFSSPYVHYGAQLIVREDDTDIIDLASLYGKKVAVGLGTNYEAMLREFDQEGLIEIVTYDSGSGIYQDLAIGRVDAAINDRLALQSVIKESGLPLKLAGAPINELENAFPFVKNESNEARLKAINEAIDTLYRNGTMRDLSLKYFEIDITQRYSQ